MTKHNSQIEIAAILPESANRLSAFLSGDRRERERASHDSRRPFSTVWIGGVLTPEYLSDVRRELLALLSRDDITDVILRIDSPGGFIFGVPETASLVRRLAQKKTVTVVAENLLASAAYWIASGATRIIAAPTTLVGSIGVVSVLVDDSAAFEADGVRVIPVASADAKADGLPGVAVSKEQVDRVQRRVTHLARWFMRDVNRAQRMTSTQVLDAIEGAEVFYADEALPRGYIDQVLSVEDAMVQVRKQIKATSPNQHGEAAVDALAEIANEKFGTRYLFELSGAQESQLKRQHPALVASVDAYQEDKESARNYKNRHPFST